MRTDGFSFEKLFAGGAVVIQPKKAPLPGIERYAVMVCGVEPFGLWFASEQLTAAAELEKQIAAGELPPECFPLYFLPFSALKSISVLVVPTAEHPGRRRRSGAPKEGASNLVSIDAWRLLRPDSE